MKTFKKMCAAFLIVAGPALVSCQKMESSSGEVVNVSNAEDYSENASETFNEIATEAGQALPEFKLPAPRASAQADIPRDLFPSGAITLQQVNDSLRSRLKSAGYEDLGYYRVTNGFALATAMERIGPDGRPFPGDKRWITEASGLASLAGPLTLSSMMSALLHADPGSYRVIVFVVSNRQVTSSAAPMSSDVAKSLVVDGPPALPRKFSEVPFGPGYQVTALIYEFNRTAVGKPAQFSRPSTRSAAQQLRLARILEA